MSSTSTEQAIVSAKANVMIYDDLTKKWNPAGVTSGLSKVYIYQNLLNQTYRVVGRKIQDHECVINCMLSKAVKHQANQTFLQWRDVKQVYGLHFQSKEDADLFGQVLKNAVDNLARIAASNSNGGGDNISLGKRSISSEYNNPLIYDENDRQIYNLNGHHPNNNYIANNSNRMQQTQHQQQQVTSPPLSNSSSSSSSTISSSGLSINTVNGGQNGHIQQQLTNGQHLQTNGHHQQQVNNAYQMNNNNQRQNSLVDYNNYSSQQQQQQQQQQQLHQTPVYNLQQQINTSSTSSSSSSSSVGSGGGSSNPLNQHPLYQSSPIPPPPPPPSVPIFANQNNNISSSHDNNHPQKIYDVIPDNSNYTSSHQTNTASVPPPPPPPMPIGLFGTSSGSGGAPPPPPPLSSMQSLNLNNNNARPSATSHADELSRSIANRQLKKVDENSSSSITSSSSSSSSSSSRGGPPQLDFLTEIRQKLEAKNLGINGGSSNENENLKPSNGLKKISRTALNNDSPKPIKKITSSPNVIPNGGSGSYSSSNLTNGANNTTNNSSNSVNNQSLDNQSYDRLKQELMSEFRKELQMIKSDIVNSILQELRR